MSDPELKQELEADQRALRRARRRARHERQLHLGVMVIPSLFTFGNMLCGFIGIVLAVEGNFTIAAALIGIAMIFDLLDGRLARLLNASSKFGLELDSLADLVSFCLAPGLILYLWQLHRLGKLGVAIGFFYLMAGAGRLARFNIITVTASKRYFLGMPTPPAAGFLMAIVFMWPDADDLVKLAANYGIPLAPVIGALAIAVALLMVSTVPFRTFKDINFGRHHPLLWLMALAALVMAMIWQTEWVLLGSALLYLLSAPLFTLVRLLTGKPSPMKTASPAPAQELAAETP